MKQKIAEHSYIAAIALAAIAVGGQVLASRAFGLDAPFLFLFAAIAVSSWIGGARAGFLTTVLLALAADYHFIAPVGHFLGKSATGWFTLGAFVLEALLLVALFEIFWRENRKLHQELEAIEACLERAEESNRVKRDFIANMSHGIRAPLTAILGFSDFLAAERITDEERRDYAERLKLNATSLTHLVSDLLDVTEIDSAGFIAHRKRIVLGDFVQNLYAKFLPLAEENGLKFQVQMRGSLPAFIESDPEQLEQVIRHIVDNAIHYCKDGLIKLTVTASKSGGRRELAVIVADQGPGIPSEVKSKLFKPFGRESGQEDPSRGALTHGGTGLGLTLSRRLARGLGGDVKLVKSNGRGTTFLVTIDAGPIDEAHELIDELTLSAPIREVKVDDPHALEGVRVLIVDDSPDSALLVGRMLKIVGANVETADRGSKGIEKALELKPDVVLMDIEMPEMDGNEAIRRLRARGFGNPIIALSAHVMKEDQKEAERAGSSEFLMKPVSRRRLLEMVGRFARLNRLTHAHV